MTTPIEDLTARLREFVAARDWQRFHTPKNLAMALAGEAGELLAEFQWLTPEESTHVMADPEAGARVRAEIADVTIYLLRLADVARHRPRRGRPRETGGERTPLRRRDLPRGPPARPRPPDTISTSSARGPCTPSTGSARCRWSPTGR